ncbi:RNA-binding protein [Schnuerera sp.]|uniref:YlmH family RNA-binding protein n=1 Tax=Schnuerera sp. TaxID=2794844 RepID=UPI002BCCF21C|nr:YlmH/Sll1252 family protein [Schnuerera sp.]HSH36239.1 YlmH/Sll1252 family protein [Schnuerera sp.]
MKLRLDKEKLLAHIVDEKQILNMRRVLDQIEIVINKHTIGVTDFMDPYERKLAESILNRFMDISYSEIGGIEKAERKVILIYPEYMKHQDIKSPISSLMINGNIKNLSHRDFLGGILNLGINREKIGDILIHEDNVQVVVKNEIFDYILISLMKIGKENVKVKEIPLEKLRKGILEYEDIYTTVSSLRLDALISGAWNLSRKDGQRLVESKKVKVNWEPIDRVFKDIEEGDIISAKGYGRFILNSINGISKKGRVRVKLRLLK